MTVANRCARRTPQALAEELLGSLFLSVLSPSQVAARSAPAAATGWTRPSVRPAWVASSLPARCADASVTGPVIGLVTSLMPSRVGRRAYASSKGSSPPWPRHARGRAGRVPAGHSPSCTESARNWLRSFRCVGWDREVLGLGSSTRAAGVAYDRERSTIGRFFMRLLAGGQWGGLQKGFRAVCHACGESWPGVQARWSIADGRDTVHAALRGDAPAGLDVVLDRAGAVKSDWQ